MTDFNFCYDADFYIDPRWLAIQAIYDEAALRLINTAAFLNPNDLIYADEIYYKTSLERAATPHDEIDPTEIMRTLEKMMKVVYQEGDYDFLRLLKNQYDAFSDVYFFEICPRYDDNHPDRHLLIQERNHDRPK